MSNNEAPGTVAGASNFTLALERRLEELRRQDLFRELRRVNSPQGPRIEVDGRDYLNFSSNDYLGLANDPRLREAAIKAVERFGCGSGASRLICGSLAPHGELEEALAAFKNTDAALSFAAGDSAALGTIGALMGKGDIVVLDKLAHACMVDAARLCGAKLRVFPHNDLAALEDILRWADTQGAGEAQKRPRVLIVTESVFSMDGDAAPLRELVSLKDRYGAWLMLDEAHATGLYGTHRRGLAEEAGVSDRIEIQMGTLGKAMGASGGFIAGPKALIDFLINQARSFIFSTAPVPAAAAAARAAIAVVQSEEGKLLCERLWSVVLQTRRGLAEAGWTIPTGRSAITPLILGDEARALNAARALREQGMFIPAIRYPTVARGQARLRLTLTAAHTEAQVAALLAALKESAPHA